MSYSKKIEYEIVPKESFSVIRNCSGCGKKTHFKNTKKFRVNANGNKLDVWLIYQCENCRHTFNLTVYERQKATSVPRQEYACFLDNDEQTADAYGRNFQFFKQNKAEIDFSHMEYHFRKLIETEEETNCRQPIWILVHNPCALKIRPEKQIAEVLGLSRSHVKRWMEEDQIKMDILSPQLISFYVYQPFPDKETPDHT